MREFGLTGQKSAYCRGLALRIFDDRLDPAAVVRADETTARAQATCTPTTSTLVKD